MTIKVTMLFQSENYSWSESHYLLAANDFVAAVTPAEVLVLQRRSLLGTYATIKTCRLSKVPADRQVYDLPPSDILTSGGSFSSIPGGNASDQPFTSLLVNLQNATANKNLYLAGIPDGVVQVDPEYPNGYKPGGDFDTELTSYLSHLCGDFGAGPAWGFRSRIKLPGTMVNALADQPGYGNNIGVSTAADPGIAAGHEANLSGFKRINSRLPSLAGAYTVVAVIPPGSGNVNWITILEQTGNVNGDNFFKLGVIAPLTFQYLSYQYFHVVRATHRKRGGSYGLPRGRSRARR